MDLGTNLEKVVLSVKYVRICCNVILIPEFFFLKIALKLTHINNFFYTLNTSFLKCVFLYFKIL